MAIEIVRDRQPEIRTADFGGKQAVILWDGRTGTAAAYAPETEGNPGEPVNLTVDSSDAESPWVDSQTRSRWSIAGRASSGSRKGQTLRWLPGVMVKWYAWAAEYPKTSLESLDRRAAGRGGQQPDKALSRDRQPAQDREGGIQPQAVVDDAGILHLIYFKGDPAAGDLYYVRSSPGTTEFTKPIRVNSQPGSAVAVGTIRGGQLALGRGGTGARRVERVAERFASQPDQGNPDALHATEQGRQRV